MADLTEQIAQAFQTIDENGDGTVEYSEMMSILKKLDPTLEDDLLEVVIKSADANGDGSVDYPEFCAWVMSGDETSAKLIKTMGSKGRRRMRCKFGDGCYRRNREHREKFCHPGDPDYTEAALPREPRAPPPPLADGLPDSIKQCPACGIYIEKLEGDDNMMCGCEAKAAGGTTEKALANGGCGHEFVWTTLAPVSYGKPGEPANERQVLFAPAHAAPALTLPTAPPGGRSPTGRSSTGRSPKPGRGRHGRHGSRQSVYPAYWTNGRSREDFLEFRTVDTEDLTKFDELLRATYAAKVTQDRLCPRGVCPKTPGGCACVQVYSPDLLEDLPEDVPGLPVAYRARRVIRIENSRDWSEYVNKRTEIRKKREGDSFRSFDPPVMTAEVVDKYSELFEPLDKDYNETYLMHGTNVKAAISIAKSDFRVDLAGSAAGTMYGRGVYMAESCTKADEYASDEPGTSFEGVFALLICRTIMGKLYYTTKRREDAEDRVESGSHDSTIGDRMKSVDTFREFVAYDKEQIYAEYLVLYHRVHVRDDLGVLNEKLKEDLDIDVAVH